MTDEPRYVTNSELQALKQCRRQWYLGYYRRLAKRRNDGSGKAAQTGTLVHDALEQYYKDPARDASKVLVDFRKRRITDPEADTYAKEYALADAMIDGYFEWLSVTGADQDLIITSVEGKITCPAPAPFDEMGVELLGKLDLVAERDGILYTLDHKTVQGFDSVISLLPMNEQSRHYAVIQRRNNPDRPIQGSIWNMLRKVKRTATAKPPFYLRSDIAWSDKQLGVFWHRLHGEITVLLELQAALDAGADHQEVAYPTPSNDCTWRCPFYAVCPHMDDPRTDSESLIDVMYVQWNPLERYDNPDNEETT